MRSKFASHNRLLSKSKNETQRHHHLRLQVQLLPVLMAVFLVMDIINPSRIWVVLLTGLGMAWLISYVWARSLAHNLSFKREMRFGWAQVGDRLEEHYILKTTGIFPALWVEVTDKSTLPGYHTSRVTGVDGKASTEWRTEGTCTQRGLYTLGPTDLVCSDPFGFYSIRINDPASRLVMVLPPVVALPAIEIAPGGRSGEGRPRTNAPERTVSSSNVREYFPGDSSRWIHWRTSARRNELFVKVFDGTPTGDWRILLDLDASVQYGQGGDSTEEHGVILAASLTHQGLRLRHPVGITINGRELHWVPPRSGENQRWEVLRALAIAQPGSTSLAEMLYRLETNIRSSTSLVVITAAAKGEWLEALLPLAWRGVTPTILMLDPISFATPGQLNPPDPKPLLDQLADYGIQHYRITKDLLDRPEARPGTTGRWEWRVTPRGRAIAVQRPADLEWKSL